MTPTNYANTVRSALLLVENAQRGTGRTHRLLERVRDGDVVIVTKAADRRFLLEQLALRGKDKVRVRVVDPYSSYGLIAREIRDASMWWRGFRGSVVFSHEWKQAYAEKMLVGLAEDLDAERFPD